MIFTTSWDDGYKHDLLVANLLDKYGATGTFYVCPKSQHNQIMLTKDELVELGNRHELGAHTMSHAHLTKIPQSEVLQELTESKKWIEFLTNKECLAFCYPYGDENEEVQTQVKDAGFKVARTVEQLQFCPGKNLLTMPTSLLVYPFPIRPILNRRCLEPLLSKRKRLQELHVPLFSYRSWLSLAKALFRQAVKTKQPFFHLWGHSAEVDKYNQWQELENFLAFVAKYEVQHCKNSELI